MSGGTTEGGVGGESLMTETLLPFRTYAVFVVELTAIHVGELPTASVAATVVSPLLKIETDAEPPLATYTRPLLELTATASGLFPTAIDPLGAPWANETSADGITAIPITSAEASELRASPDKVQVVTTRIPRWQMWRPGACALTRAQIPAPDFSFG